jgi:methyl-accepting chemotaxis protein
VNTHILISVAAAVGSDSVTNSTMLAFVIVAAVAIVLQTVILYALYRTMNQATQRMEDLAGRLESQTTPVLAMANAILDDAKPKIAEITSNLAESTAAVREQVTSMAEATNEIVDRARMQAARLDELVSNTVSKIEVTTDFVQHSVITPVRRIHAIAQAVSAGLSFLRASRASRKHERNGPGSDVDEEMFI